MSYNLTEMTDKNRLRILMGKSKKVLLPFFPDNQWLKKHWWHRLAMILAFIISASSLYTLLFGIIMLLLLGTNIGIGHSGIGTMLFLLLFLPVNISIIITKPLDLNNLTSSLGNDLASGVVLFVITFLILALVPSLFYRLILFIFLGEGWKNKS